ncbi:hypothetical protein [Actinokineospora auranticolor]|uniref:hypothetical protein n=1 Tax=Actinokineospora auranticolor TaxID=155976 RepID=UPI0035A8B777
MAHLAEHQIPLEVCPTSNVRTRQVDSIATHPGPAHTRPRLGGHPQHRRTAHVRRHPGGRVPRGGHRTGPARG